MDHLLDGFDWEKLGSGVVVDVSDTLYCTQWGLEEVQ
jgi:hypothetical protein